MYMRKRGVQSSWIRVVVGCVALSVCSLHIPNASNSLSYLGPRSGFSLPPIPIESDSGVERSGFTVEIPAGKPNAPVPAQEVSSLDHTLFMEVPVTLREAKELIEKYHFLERIGHGGMGVVFKVRNKISGELMALKVMRGSSAEANRRFKQEAKILSYLQHEHILRIHEVGSVEDLLYFTMPFHESGNLKEFVQEQGKLGGKEAAQKAIQILSALSYVHTAVPPFPIIHRDVKPRNILIDQAGNLKLADFGLAKNLGQEHLTRSGTRLGSPRYMSPEQARGERVDPQTDLYSAGAVLYYMLTGEHFIQGQTRKEILSHVLNQNFIPNNGISVEMGIILDRALAKNPKERYTTAEAFINDLKRFLKGEPVGELGGRTFSSKKSKKLRQRDQNRLAARPEMDRAEKLIEEREFHGAMAILNQITEKYPHYENMLLLVRLARILKGDGTRIWKMFANKDMRILDRAILMNPSSWHSFYLRGLLYGLQEKYALAEQDLLRTIELNPHFSEAYARLSEIYSHEDESKAESYRKKGEQVKSAQGMLVVNQHSGENFEDESRLSISKSLAISESATKPEIGHIGKYEVREKLGEGGLGVVYRVYDPDLNQEKALKILHASASILSRNNFQREYRLLKDLIHPLFFSFIDSFKAWAKA